MGLVLFCFVQTARHLKGQINLLYDCSKSLQTCLFSYCPVKGAETTCTVSSMCAILHPSAKWARGQPGKNRLAKYNTGSTVAQLGWGVYCAAFEIFAAAVKQLRCIPCKNTTTANIKVKLLAKKLPEHGLQFCKSTVDTRTYLST